MTFQFSFQKVLDVKEKEKEVAQQEYGRIKHHQLELEERIVNLENEKETVLNQYNDVNRKKVSELLSVHQEMEHVYHRMKQLELESKQIHQQVEQKHQVLIEKMQESKMWNNWKEKSKAAFLKQLNQKEQILLDEMAVLSYSRKV